MLGSLVGVGAQGARSLRYLWPRREGDNGMRRAHAVIVHKAAQTRAVDHHKTPQN